MRTLPFLALVLTIGFAGCAKGTTSTTSTAGQGGTGAAGGGGQGNTGNVPQGGDGGTGNSGNSGGAGGDAGAGGSDCPAMKHLCGGVCVGNTPSTGCYTSETCSPCPPPPVGGTTVCSAEGVCDFTCPAPYMKNGNACTCPEQCCSDADCPGGTCNAGTCVVNPPMCDQFMCQFSCFAMCFGVGTCGPNGCECVCSM